VSETATALDVDIPLAERLTTIAGGLSADGVYDPNPDGERHFRIGAPFVLEADQVAFLERLGDRLLAFNAALGALYRKASKGKAPAFVADWLDQGKPDEVVRLGAMNRFRNDLPRVIRPDLLLTDDGWKITELDSVPGGMGLTDSLQRHYAAAGFHVLGGADGMVDGMAAALNDTVEGGAPLVAIVVSEESAAYRPEMRHLAARLRDAGTEAHVVAPEAVVFAEEGLFITPDGDRCARRVDVVYRFFELFDLPNIPKAELLLYAAKKGRVAMTPPPRPQLEEKLGAALFHHPALAPFWRAELGEEAQRELAALLPRTWVLDPAPVPPYAVIPDLNVDGVPVQGWQALKGLGQKARQFVIKPSGFSEQAWGSRGVVIGHDQPEAGWDQALDAALAAFGRTPHILQPFHKAVTQQTRILGDEGGIRAVRTRSRLCPYYFVAGGKARLGGVLATPCPADKKKLHGMKDASMIPCVGPSRGAID